MAKESKETLTNGPARLVAVRLLRSSPHDPRSDGRKHWVIWLNVAASSCLESEIFSSLERSTYLLLVKQIRMYPRDLPEYPFSFKCHVILLSVNFFYQKSVQKKDYDRSAYF